MQRSKMWTTDSRLWSSGVSVRKAEMWTWSISKLLADSIFQIDVKNTKYSVKKR